MSRGRRPESSRTRIPQAAHRDIDGRIPEDHRDDEPRPETLLDWVVWLALWPIVTVAWLVSIPFVVGYVAVGFLVEVIFGVRLRRSDDSDGAD